VWQDVPGSVGEVTKFVCGKMFPNFRRRLQLVLTWLVSDVRSRFDLRFVVCCMCMEELLYVQIYSGCCVWWTAMFGNVGSAW